MNTGKEGHPSMPTRIRDREGSAEGPGTGVGVCPTVCPGAGHSEPRGLGGAGRAPSGRRTPSSPPRVQRRAAAVTRLGKQSREAAGATRTRTQSSSLSNVSKGPAPGPGRGRPCLHRSAGLTRTPRRHQPAWPRS